MYVIIIQNLKFCKNFSVIFYKQISKIAYDFFNKALAFLGC